MERQFDKRAKFLLNIERYAKKAEEFISLPLLPLFLNQDEIHFLVKHLPDYYLDLFPLCQP